MSATRVKFSDEDFLEGLKNGDHGALSALYKKFYPVVLKLIINNSGTEDEAKDVYQEAVIVLYENARKEGFELNCQMQTYIYSVARRLWLKQLRSNGRTLLYKEEETGLADVTEDVAVHLEKEEHIRKMNNSLSALGEPCATLIKDFYMHKMSMEAISDKFGYTNPENAKTQKYKCLQRLKKYFFHAKVNEEQER